MHKPSPAVAIATVALFFSIVGTGLAASKYLITSTSQIKPSVLKSLRGDRGPAGAPGAQGLQGLQGAAGAAGAAGVFTASDTTIVDGPTVSSLAAFGQSGDSGTSVATCPTGDVAIGGGYAGTGLLDATTSQPTGGSWFVAATNAFNTTASFFAVAVCTS
jgi:hypothetical protein